MAYLPCTNIPHEGNKDFTIEKCVEGSSVYIVASHKGSEWRKGAVQITSLLVSDHLLAKPDVLRNYIGDAICAALRQGRRAGYRQAQRDIRDSMGIPTTWVEK